MDRFRAMARRVLNSVGSPITITILAILVSCGLGASFILSIRSTNARELDARRSAALSEMTDLSLELLFSLQDEHSLGQLWLATGATPDLEDYRDAFDATDRRVDAQAATVQRHEALFSEASFSRPDAVTTALASLNRVRKPVLAGTGNDTDESYATITSALRSWLADQSFVTAHPDHVRLRRAMSALLGATEAANQRRVTVSQALADGGLTDDEQTQVTLLGRDIRANIEQAARILESVPSMSEVDMHAATAGLTTSPATVDVARALSSPDTTPRAWFEAATRQFQELRDVTTAINDDVRRRVVDARDEARADRVQRSLLLGTLFGLSIVAGAGAIVVSRERLAALREHDDLLSGLRTWFLPESLPDHEGLDFAARYLPAAAHADAGGDWYDAFVDPRGVLTLVMGDVSGHDPTTVSHMAELRNIIRGVVHAGGGSPAEILSTVDATARAGRLATVFLAQVPPTLDRVRYSRAGHMPAVLRRAGGAVEVLGTADLPLGIDPTTPRRQGEARLGEGDLLLLFTDGLIDRPGAFLPAEMDRVCTIVGESDVDLTVLADLLARARDPGAADDCSILLVQRVSPDRDAPADKAVTSLATAPPGAAGAVEPGRVGEDGKRVPD